jgi:DNA-binding transcriptional ArsR family regulator
VCATRGNVPDRLDRTFAALADPHRRAVVDLLRRQPMKASDIADALAMSRPAMSRHLRVLRLHGLVEERSPDDDARVRLYRLRREPFSQARGWFEEVEAFWADQLQAFKQHAERKQRRRGP